MRGVAIAASPRDESNSEALLDAAIATLVAGGVPVTKYRLAELDVRPCVAHANCRELRRCPHPDHFAAVAEEAMEADVVLFAIPVYYWGVPAQFKAYIDRHLHYYGLRRYRARAIGIVIVAHNDGLDEAAEQMHSFLSKGGHAALPWAEVDTLKVYAAGPGEAARDRDLIEAARSLGSGLLLRLKA